MKVNKQSLIHLCIFSQKSEDVAYCRNGALYIFTFTFISFLSSTATNLSAGDIGHIPWLAHLKHLSQMYISC